MTESSTEASSQDPSGVGSEPLRSSHRGVMWHIEPGLPPKNPDSRRKRKKLTKDQQVGFPGGASGKEPTCQCRRYKRLGFDPWVGKIPWRRTWQPTPVFLPGESYGQSSPQGCTELDMTERLNSSSSTFPSNEIQNVFYYSAFRDLL